MTIIAGQVQRVFGSVGLAFLATITLVLAGPVGVCKAGDATVECTPRGGLPHFFAKIQKGGEIRIAYLGGSITAQTGWRIQSREYFQKTFPKATFKQISAGIPGTGSDLGVLRMDRDVLRGKPDLLFVEFAVNDAGAEPGQILKSMEGIVRKTRAALPECDICFVYTLTDGLLPELRTGKLNRSAALMETVADVYAIPTINFGCEVVRLEKEGKLSMKAPEVKSKTLSAPDQGEAPKIPVGQDGKIPFSKDGVHPYLNTGHRLYTDAIIRSIPKLMAVMVTPARTLPAPMDPKNYENTTTLAFEKATVSGPWTNIPNTQGVAKEFANNVDSLWKGEPGATLSFKFKGSGVMLYEVMGPDCGSLEVTVDGKLKKVILIDGECYYYRLKLFKIAEGLDPEKIHAVSVKVLPDPLDKAKIIGKWAVDAPAKYAPLNCYAGAFFLIGSLAE